jgi:hypothetical protein
MAGLPDDALEADYAGIRPKIVGTRPQPTLVVQVQTRGAGLREPFGIESLGLTAALPLADAVLDQLS